MCQFNSSQKIKADPSADLSEAFTVNQDLSIVGVRKVLVLELMPAA